MSVPLTATEVWEIIIPFLKTNARLYTGLPDLDVRQNFQPIQSGAPSPASLALHIIHTHRYGMAERRDNLVTSTGTFISGMTQKVFVTFQATALYTPKDPDTATLSAFDVASIGANVLQTDEAIKYWRDNGINIFKITDIRSPYFIDERHQNEQAPNFDFVLAYEQNLNAVIPAVDGFDLEIDRV